MMHCPKFVKDDGILKMNELHVKFFSRSLGHLERCVTPTLCLQMYYIPHHTLIVRYFVSSCATVRFSIAALQIVIIWLWCRKKVNAWRYDFKPGANDEDCTHESKLYISFFAFLGIDKQYFLDIACDFIEII